MIFKTSSILGIGNRTTSMKRTGSGGLEKMDGCRGTVIVPEWSWCAGRCLMDSPIIIDNLPCAEDWAFFRSVAYHSVPLQRSYSKMGWGSDLSFGRRFGCHHGNPLCRGRSGFPEESGGRQEYAHRWARGLNWYIFWYGIYDVLFVDN